MIAPASFASRDPSQSTKPCRVLYDNPLITFSVLELEDSQRDMDEIAVLLNMPNTQSITGRPHSTAMTQLTFFLLRRGFSDAKQTSQVS